MDKYNGIERYIFRDTYNLLTAYINGDGSELYWEALMSDSRALAKKYRNNDLCCKLLIAILDNIEFKQSGNIDGNGITYVGYNRLKNEIIGDTVWNSR